MRVSSFLLPGYACLAVVACSVDYAGILSGKDCDPSGGCTGGYFCDRASWKCLPGREAPSGGTADAASGADAAFREDADGDAAVADAGWLDAGKDTGTDSGDAEGVDAGLDSGDAPDVPADVGFDAADESDADGALSDGSADVGDAAALDSGIDGGTDSGGCVPTSHAGTVCIGSDVYWVDSCGKTEEMKDDCTAPQVCHEAACCTPADCAALAKECGTWDDGCGGEVFCPSCPGKKLCLDGTCQTVIFVKADATGSGDGSSWTNAFTKVQDALDVSAAGDHLWVAGGTYTRRGGASEVAKLPVGVSVFGGFAGTEGWFSERDLRAGHETVLKGQNGVRVVEGASNATLDGITITEGGAGGGNGGGILLFNNSRVKIGNCRMTANSAHWGGGIHLFQSDAEISDSEISSNTATDGGGIFNQNSTVVLDRVVVSGNVSQGAVGGGGGLFNDSATSTIVNSVFSGNAAQASFAGGIYNNYTSTHTVTNCTFFGNTSRLGGGAIFNNINASPAIANSIFWNNTPDEIQDYPGYGSHAQVRYSDVRGGRAGDGNKDSDPVFMNAANQEFRLAKGSPCIDAADGDVAPPNDKNGVTRGDDPATPDTGRGSPPYADMGPFEYAP